MTKKFTHCNVPESQMLYKWHVYTNNTMHIVCICPKCGKYMGNSPQVSPYTDLVAGRYISSPKKEKPTTQQIKAIGGNDNCKTMLAYILSIPDIESAICKLTYDKASKMI